MKKILFEVLNKMEPYDILEISTSNYHIELCRADAIFPLACNLERIYDYEDMYRREYDYALEAADFRSTPPSETSITEEHNSTRDYMLLRNRNRNKYIEDHTIELNGLKFVIMNEILDIKYKEDYVEVQYSSQDGKLTLYFLYSDIKSIRYRENGESVDDLKEYNSIQHSINKK